jgi:predicted S18 family serine protease
VLSAIQILIERTKTHPEEFNEKTYGKIKWDDLINNYSPCMTQDERDALAAAMTEAKRTLFNEAVMKRLVGIDGADAELAELEEIAIKMANSAKGLKPKSVLTISQITNESLKILEDKLGKGLNDVTDPPRKIRMSQFEYEAYKQGFKVQE